MGNCCMRESSSRELAGDDWGPMAKENYSTTTERQRLLGNDHEGGFSYNSNNIASSGGSAITREVKIKISKRELEELMVRMEIQGLSMEQILARLINSGHANEIGLLMDHHYRHWKPALQSIPETELDEF